MVPQQLRFVLLISALAVSWAFLSPLNNGGVVQNIRKTGNAWGVQSSAPITTKNKETDELQTNKHSVFGYCNTWGILASTRDGQRSTYDREPRSYAGRGDGERGERSYGRGGGREGRGSYQSYGRGGEGRGSYQSYGRGGEGRGGRGGRGNFGRGGRGGRGRGRGRGPGRGRGSYEGGRGSYEGGRGNYQGGGRSPQIQLANPLKVQRIAPQQNNQGRGRGRNNDQRREQTGGRSAAGNASNRPRRPPMGGGPSMGRGGGGDDAPASDNRPKRNFGQKKKPGTGNDYRKPRNSLRIGTSGKKSRSAQKNMSRGSLRKRDRSKEKAEKEMRAIERKTIELPEGPMTVSALAELLDEKPVGVIKFLMTDLGIMAAMTQSLDPATCIAVAEGFGRFVGEDDWEDEDDDEEEDETALDIGYAIDDEDPDSLVTRPPVVTIMGHVDHGKTSLLDALRDSRVTSGEAGGITQHIGAYQIERDGKQITFIDTPGHAAFTDMRQRGANITDIVILVVAADDGVKQQTADSIACARQAGVPLIVAVNKIDLPTADIDRVKSDLTGYDVLTEDLGGDILCTEVSAKKKLNLGDLLEKILLQAEIQDLKANPDREAQGAVVEARVEKGLGTVATTLIQKGTIRVGDIFVAGQTSGRVKALIGPDGKTRVKEAGPSTPISVVGFDGVPSAGDLLVVCDDEQMARELAESRSKITREKEAAAYQAGLMKSVAATFAADGKFKEQREMCVVVKADVQGSAEALTNALRNLKREDDEAIVTIKVLVSESGDVTKSDVAIAAVTPDTAIIAFNCAATYEASEDARQQGIPIGYHSIIYDAIESVESRMQEVLSPTPEGDYVGNAIVQEVFSIGGTGNIAGSRCQDGIIKKGSNVRVMRGDKILAESTVRTLRNFKAEVDKIETGDECGVGLFDFEDFQPGDIIESYVVT